MRSEPLKRLASNPIVKSPTKPMPYVALEHIVGNLGRPVDGFEPALRSESSDVVFQPGDVLFGKLRPYLGKVLHASAPGCASLELLVIRPGPRLLSRFLYYVALSRPFIEWATATSYGTKMPRTSWEQLRDFEIRLPELEEQEELATMLDEEIERVDGIVDRLVGPVSIEPNGKGESLAGLLLEKRQALITWAVLRDS